MLVQWNRPVRASRLVSVTVLEKDLSVLQRPLATETGVPRRGSFLSGVELATGIYKTKHNISRGQNI